MRGGVTSGVLYPSAIREIAKAFHLIGIGGTSAGAIAACAAAAAEYRRRIDGSFEGFDQMTRISSELADEGRLVSLFRPDPATKDLFDDFRDLLEKKMGAFRKARLIVCHKRIIQQIVDNKFGLCSGMAQDESKEPPLTLWMSNLINELAGRAPDDDPLTFRDLHDAPVPDGLADVLGARRRRSVDLRCVTTCVTFRRPFELPLRMKDQKIFAFDPDEWERYFPAHIVEYLTRKAAAIESPMLKRGGKLPLPIEDLPVVVAARMSLSFPLLFSMVPLWCVNHHLADKPLMPVWFSDGGITSNFPMHRFDALYPRWPTIGLNLRYTDKSNKPQRKRLRESGGMVYLPSQRRQALDLWDRFDQATDPREALFGFAKAVFSSAQEWHDNAFLKLPSYRDRSVEIWLKKGEGGLQIGMPRDKVLALIERGREAGQRAVERFVDLPDHEPMSWQGHRWARFRSGMSGLMTLLNRLDVSIATDMPGDVPLDRYLDGAVVPPAYTKKLDRAQREGMKAVVEALRQVAQDARTINTCTDADEEADRPFCRGPDPHVDIGSRAPF